MAAVHAAAVVAGFAALVTLAYSGVLLSGRVLVAGDALLYHWVFFAAPLTLWSPNVFAGFPLAADPQTMSWYPVSWLFKLGGSWDAFALSAFVMAGAFTYGYVHAVTRSRLAAAVSSTSFALAGFMAGHLGHTAMQQGAAWLPLLVWSVERLRHRSGERWTVGAAVAVAGCALAGHPQMLVYGGAMAAAYALWRSAAAAIGRRAHLAACAFAVVAGAAMAGVQLLTTAELIPLTVRAEPNYEQFVAFSFPLRQWRMVLSPFLYGGGAGEPYVGEPFQPGYVSYLPIAVWMLAVLGLLAGGAAERGLRAFWAVVAVVALTLALGGNLPPLAAVLYHVPVLAPFRAPGRHLLEFSFALSVLGGLGVAALRAAPLPPRRALWVVVALCAAPLAATLSGRDLGGGWTAPVLAFSVFPLLSAAVVLAWLRRPGARVASLGLAMLVALDAGAFSAVFHWPSKYLPSEALHEPPLARALEAGLAPLHQRFIGGGPHDPENLAGNLPAVWGVPSVSGYGPLPWQRLCELLRADPASQVPAATLAPEDQSLDVLAVRYRLAPSTGVPGVDADSPPSDTSRWRRVEPLAGVAVYENRRALPRAFLVGRVRVVTATEARNALQTSVLPDGTAFDARTTALVEEPVALTTSSELLAGARAWVTKLTDTRVDVATDAPRDALLVASDVDYPGWRATVDGRPARIHRTDYMLRGVTVPAGTHRVSFLYRPRRVAWGALVSLAGILLTCAAPAVARRLAASRGVGQSRP